MMELTPKYAADEERNRRLVDFFFPDLDAERRTIPISDDFSEYIEIDIELIFMGPDGVRSLAHTLDELQSYIKVEENTETVVALEYHFQSSTTLKIGNVPTTTDTDYDVRERLYEQHIVNLPRQILENARVALKI